MSRPRLAGTAPPQKATSTAHCPAAAARFTASDAGSSVGGRLLSGMSTIVVTPPAAAARVAVANPSHSVRPGSLTCTWVSTSPGSSTTSSPSSTTGLAPLPRTDRSSGPTPVITPPATVTVTACSPVALIAAPLSALQVAGSGGSTARGACSTRSGRADGVTRFR